jgi:hypothetical protein
MVIFQDHFTRANKERIRKLTAQAAGYHGAHSAVVVPPAGANSAAVTPPPAIGTTTPPAAGTLYYYCWTHGLGKNDKHTSAQCNNKATGHKDTATAANMMGGNNKVMSPVAATTEPDNAGSQVPPTLVARHSLLRIILSYLLFPSQPLVLPPPFLLRQQSPTLATPLTFAPPTCQCITN